MTALLQYGRGDSVLNTPPFAMPTLIDTFGHNKHLYDILRGHGFTSVVAVMAMPPEALKSLEGIKSVRSKQITEMLAAKGLTQRSISQSMAAFITDQFGSIEDAPVGVLQITIVREMQVNYPQFAPMEAVSLLEDIEPHFTVGDLTSMSRSELRNFIEESAAFGIELHNIGEDIRHLGIRLGNYDLSFQPGRLVALPKAVNQ